MQADVDSSSNFLFYLLCFLSKSLISLKQNTTQFLIYYYYVLKELMYHTKHEIKTQKVPELPTLPTFVIEKKNSIVRPVCEMWICMVWKMFLYFVNT